MNKNQNEKVKSRGKRAFIYTASVILSAFLLSLILMFTVNDAFSLTATAGTTEITVPRDTGVYGVSKILKDSDLIDSRIWFTLYSRLRGKGDTVKAGVYKISNTGGFDGILNTLKSGK